MPGKELVAAAVIAVALHCSMAFVRVPVAVNLLEIKENKTLEMSLVPAYKEVSEAPKVEVHEPRREKPREASRERETVHKRAEKNVKRKEADQAEEKRKPDRPRKIAPVEMPREETRATNRPREIVSEEKPREEKRETGFPREITPATIPGDLPSLHAVRTEDRQIEQPVIVPAMPRYKDNPPPKYPAIARRRGYEGRVLLSVMISVDGTVTGLTVKESSGHLILDRAALRAVEAWKFEPARRMGSPIPLSVDVPVRFVLKKP